MKRCNLSIRAISLQPSPTLTLDAKAKALQASGIEILNLTAGEPDTEMPQKARDAIVQALREGKTKYVAAQGVLDLRKALSNHIAKTLGVSYQPNDIVVTAGAKPGLFALFEILINPGDQVLIPTPCWVSYEEQVKQWGGKPVFVRSTQSMDLDFKALQQAITGRTIAIVINSPNNPTGRMYDRTQLEKLAAFAAEHDIYIVSDEIYSPFAFARKHISIPSLSEDAKKRTFLVHGFSKAYAMTGLRLGYIAGPQPFMEKMAEVQSQCFGNASSIIQYGGIQALQENKEVEAMVIEFRKRRDFVTEKIQAMKNVALAPTDGAFYAFIDISRAEPNSNRFCERLLDEQKVALVPGAAFHAEAWVRLSYAKSIDTLKEALSRLERFINDYPATGNS